MKHSIKHLFAIIINIICSIGLLFTLAESIIGTDPYINMLWFFLSIILFCCILHLNRKFIDNVTQKLSDDVSKYDS